MIYRRFGYLQSRVLLDKQDQLRILEEELDVFDAEHEGCSVTRAPNARIKAELQARSELLEKINVQVQSYGTLSPQIDCLVANGRISSGGTLNGSKIDGFQQTKRF